MGTTINDISYRDALLRCKTYIEKLSGIILGKHELFDDLKTGRKPYEILLEVLEDRKLPFIAEFDCCHTHPMMTLLLGSQIELNATNKKVTLIKDWLK